MEPKIIFENQEVVVIEKPAGMVANQAESVTGETVQGWFLGKFLDDPVSNDKIDKNSEFYQKGGVVHRLDKDTSGVMILAKNEAAYVFLKQQFLERKVEKKYIAMVHGGFRDKSGEVAKPLMRHPRDRKRFTTGGDPLRTAITEWKVVREFIMNNEQFTLLELFPHTGRTHQLRVHMQYLHHPIVSDSIYGFAKRWQEDLRWCPRLFLHAQMLKLVLPGGKESVFESKLPVELERALEETKPFPEENKLLH
jgi:23S rRNA pseudouridine1911/1915/1917 synthase